MKVETYKGESDFKSIPNIPTPLNPLLEKWIESNIPTTLLETATKSHWYDGSLLSSIYCNISDVEEAYRSTEIHRLVDWFVSSLPDSFWDSIQSYWNDWNIAWQDCKDNAVTEKAMAGTNILQPAIDFLNGVKTTPVVVINIQHSLLPQQEELLPDEYTLALVPATGWDLQTIRDKSKKWGNRMVILVSPIPALMSIRAKEALPFQTFHNDKREKKELPDGRIIHTVSHEGWELV